MFGVKTRVSIVLVAAGITLAVRPAAGVDVKVDVDKGFDFKGANTWGWNPEGPGEVKMARTQEDDPEAMRAWVEPVMVDAVTSELSRRGLRPATAMPDLLITYYLLLTTTMTGQTVGQFLPATTMWGVPPFAPATQSLEVMNQGALVLDLKSAGKVVWRGVAQAKIRIGLEKTEREARLREAVRDLVRRYPKR